MRAIRFDLSIIKNSSCTLLSVRVYAVVIYLNGDGRKETQKKKMGNQQS